MSRPTLIAFFPKPANATGTSVIICPGGGFTILRVRDEGTDLAKYLQSIGITAFILKYRTLESHTDDPSTELTENMMKEGFLQTIQPVIPLAIADGREAIQYVRSHAAQYHLSPERIGILGFSGGGFISVATAFNYSRENRPDFVAPIYGGLFPGMDTKISKDGPPFFIAAATDDQVGLAPASVDLYSKLIAAKRSAELHMYSAGGHGFGMVKHHIPADTWYLRFKEWLLQAGMLKPQSAKKKHK